MTRSREQIMADAELSFAERDVHTQHVRVLDQRIDALRKELSTLDGLRTPMRLEAFKQEIRK